MATKEYVFTKDEVMAIRDALIEEYHRVKNLRPASPIFRRKRFALQALKDQFIVDYANWRE